MRVEIADHPSAHTTWDDITPLARRDWILGAGPGARSVVDAYAFPMIRWGIKLLPGGIDAYPHVRALHDRLAADDAVKRVLAREAEKLPAGKG